MATRQDLTFTSAGERIAAWWYAPDAPGPHPCVVMAHGFGGIKEAGLAPFAERFAAAGMAVLVFDYRHFGASGGEPRQLLDIRRQQEDWRSAVAYVRGRSDVRSEAVGLWGTSFSGAHVVHTAAHDPRVAAVVSQVPMMDGLAALLATGPALVARFTAAGFVDVARAALGRPPYLVPIVGPPGSFAAITAPGAEEGYRSLIPPGVTWNDKGTARTAFQVPRYRAIRDVPKVRCPVLFCIAGRDAVTPPQAARRAARLAPRAEVVETAVDHFDPYTGPVFEEWVERQTRFFRTHLALEAKRPAATSEARPREPAPAPSPPA